MAVSVETSLLNFQGKLHVPIIKTGYRIATLVFPIHYDDGFLLIAVS